MFRQKQVCPRSSRILRFGWRLRGGFLFTPPIPTSHYRLSEYPNLQRGSQVDGYLLGHWAWETAWDPCFCWPFIQRKPAKRETTCGGGSTSQLGKPSLPNASCPRRRAPMCRAESENATTNELSTEPPPQVSSFPPEVSSSSF